jgi:hypothetical protein
MLVSDAGAQDGGGEGPPRPEDPAGQGAEA